MNAKKSSISAKSAFALAVLVGCIAFSGRALCQSAPTPLEGCPDPAKAARAMRELQKQPWTKLSFSKVEELWPASLRGERCEPQCARLFSEDRIIRGEMECGASFHFDLAHSGDESTGRLESALIRYSTATFDQREVVEKIVAANIRVGEDAKKGTGVATGEGIFPVITWTDDSPEHRVCQLSRRHFRVNRRWTVVIELLCDPDGTRPN